jgi:hypothetical protein
MTATNERVTTQVTRPVTTPADGPPAARGRPGWLSQYWVALLAVYSVGFAVWGAYRYVAFNSALARNVPRSDVVFHYPLFATHVLFGAVAMSLGWLQVWPWLRNNHRRVHRFVGRTYLFAGVFPAGLLALPVAVLTTSGQAVRAALFTLAVLWLSVSVAGLRAAMRHKYDLHRRWMLRSVALTTSIITLRLVYYSFHYLTTSTLGDTYLAQPRLVVTEAYSTAIWLSIAAHLLFVEWYLLRPKRRARAATAAPVREPAV